MNKIRVISHRGSFLPEGPIPTISKYKIPENTLDAFKRAFDNSWGVETDVRKTADGHFVIIHDSTVKKFSHTEGRISKMTLSQIQNLHYFFQKRFTIPTLEQICSLAKEYAKIEKTPFIAFQVKSDDSKGELDIGRAVANNMKKHHLRSSVIFDSTLEVAKILRKEFPWLNLSVSVGEENYSPTIYTPNQVFTNDFRSTYNCVWADEWKIAGSIYNEDIFKKLRAAYSGRVDVISPELHYIKDNHPLAKDLSKLKSLWQEMISFGVINGICTDYPSQLESFCI